MNPAVWWKAVVEARALLVGCAVLMYGFQWIFIWATSKVQVTAIGQFLHTLPPEFQRLAGIPIDEVASLPGRISLAYVDPIVLLLTGVWAIARGSDVISGELNRGTMELLLAQPVRRITVLVSHAAITSLGAAVIAVAAFLGTWTGLVLVALEEPVQAEWYAPAALNLFSLMYFLAGVATLASSVDQYRWRTVGFMGGFYIFGLIGEVLGRMVPSLEWMRWFTFLAALEPQEMVRRMVNQGDVWEVVLRYNGVLVGLGLACYAAAAVIFCRRDLPAPL